MGNTYFKSPALFRRFMQKKCKRKKNVHALTRTHLIHFVVAFKADLMLFNYVSGNLFKMRTSICSYRDSMEPHSQNYVRIFYSQSQR